MPICGRGFRPIMFAFGSSTMMNRGDRMNQSPILLQRSVVFLQWVCFLFIVFENLTLFRFVLDQSYADMWQKVSSNNVRFWVINNDEQG